MLAGHIRLHFVSGAKERMGENAKIRIKPSFDLTRTEVGTQNPEQR